MVNFVSPGSFVIEKDNSNFPVSVNPSVAGIVGFASQGPVDKATLITSQENLVKTFGAPAETINGQGLEGAMEILETTNSLYYVRTASLDTSTDASALVPLGACPALTLSANGFGVTADLFLDVQVAVDGVNFYNTPKQFNLPASTVTGTGATQGLALKKVLGGSLDGSPIGAFFSGTTEEASGYIASTYAGSGVVLSISAYSTNARTVAVGASALVPLSANGLADHTSYPVNTSALTISGLTFDTLGAGSLHYVAQSLHPGAGYNAGTKADGNTSGFSIEIVQTGGTNTTLQVNREGAAAEQFKVSLLASGAFVEDVINTGEVDETSEYIKGNLMAASANLTPTALPDFTGRLQNLTTTGVITGVGLGEAASVAVNPRFLKFVKSTTNMHSGNNGIPTGADNIDSTLIGNNVDKTGLYALDNDTLNISLAAIPGINTQATQNALITLAESSQNFLAVVAPPEGYTTVQEAIDWSNGQAVERTSAINSSWAAVYWPWVKVFDTFSKKDRFMDPAIFAIRQMAYTDEVAEPWFAPAGATRGRLTKPTDVEVSVNQGDRDSMYSGGNIVNPIVNFPQQGIMIFGQRTAQRTDTALNRVNVRRLLIVARKQILSSTRRFVFQPNDATEWEKVENTLNPFFDDIRRRRGLTDFKVVCDESTNTAIRVDRNELWCKVLLKPTKAAEIVVVELDITNQSAKF